MNFYKRILPLIIAFTIYSCGKDDKNEDEIPVETEQNERQKDAISPELLENDSVFDKTEDSVIAVEKSILRKQIFKQKKEVESVADNSESKPSSAPKNIKKKDTHVTSFRYLKKILNECKIGVPMTQKELNEKYNIPEEAIGLVKSLTKISENEIEIKWKSTWLVEKISDAKFTDGRMKVRFDKNKMYTSGGAIGIKHNKKTYTDLILIGRDAYIPSVKGFHWQIGKD